jgi:hypothetical protein
MFVPVLGKSPTRWERDVRAMQRNFALGDGEVVTLLERTLPKKVMRNMGDFKYDNEVSETLNEWFRRFHSTFNQSSEKAEYRRVFYTAVQQREWNYATFLNRWRTLHKYGWPNHNPDHDKEALMKIINRFVQAMLPGPNGEIQSLVQSSFMMNKDEWISQDSENVFLRLIRVCKQAHKVVAKKYAHTAVDVYARPPMACTLCGKTSHRERNCSLLDSEELRSVWGDITSPPVVFGANGDGGGEINGSRAIQGNLACPSPEQRGRSSNCMAEEHPQATSTGGSTEPALPEPEGRQAVRELRQLVAEQSALW